MDNTTKKFTRPDWFRLFLVGAFPLHLWTLLMVFRDVSWVAERTTAWDGLGFASYALLYTLVESGMLFGFIALLSLLTPRQWGHDLRYAILSLLAFALAGWSIMEQLILIVFYGRLRHLGKTFPALTADWRPLALMAILVALSVTIPLLILRSRPKWVKAFNSLLDRLMILSGLYLALDAFGIVLILIRNMAG